MKTNNIPNKMLLNASNIVAGYGNKVILNGANVKLCAGEIVLLIGPNGSGKSTLLKVLSGLLPVAEGNILLNNQNITHFPLEKRIARGISYCMQGGEIFPTLSVKENLEVVAAQLRNAIADERIDRVFELFPVLKKNVSKRAGLLSGGEKQMLALGITLIRKPKVLLLDEPSAGLSGPLVSEVLRTIQRLNIEEKFGILLVEQNVREGIPVANRVLLMKEGSTVRNENPQQLINNDKLEKLFLE